MLSPKQMSRLLIIASKDRMQNVIQELYSHRVFHIRDFVEENHGLSIGSPLPTAGEASSRLVKVRSLESTFGIRTDEMKASKRRSVRELKSIVDRDLNPLQEEVEALLAKKAAMEAELKDQEQRIRDLAPFTLSPLRLEDYRGYESLAVFMGRIGRDVAIAGPHEKVYTPSKDGNFIAVFVPVQAASETQKELERAGFTPIPVPEGVGQPKELMEQSSRRISELKAEMARMEERLVRLREERAEFIAACHELLEMEVEQAEAPLRFATTQEAFIVEGWVPVEEVDRLKSGLSLATDGKAYVQEIHDGEHVPAPVEYDNPAFARPTELLIDTYSRPRYEEIDPTLIVSIIFPIFFGLILGDVGYGILLLAVSLGLRKLLPSGDGRKLLDTMRNGAVSSIFFGILFSEFFGYGFDKFGIPWEPLLYSRHLNIGAEASHEGGHSGPMITELLMMAIWIGILQITLGRLLSAVNHYRHHGIRGVIPQFGWISVMWGILFMLWSMYALPLMPDLTGLAVVAMGLNFAGLLGLILIVAGAIAIFTESALELIEIPTIISHTLSYARLVAVGLSSVAIAMVVNYIAIGMLIGPQLEQLSIMGIVFIVMGVLVLVIGHLMNTALGVVGGGLQSLRLQYVEFFTKFYKGGGVKYNPFGKIRRFTED
ncbi:MAG: V-type ATP synthase subunit I [Methanomicrobiales archaeon]|nr:V-type ATP synthase subunit I [Methanomicrobiales archaeon]